MKGSIANQVYKIIKSEGIQSVADLYKRFPDVSKETVRGALFSSKVKIKNQTFPTFAEFVNAEAYPGPSKIITNEWVGILKHQAEIFPIFEANDNTMLNWPRGVGKTWVVAWYIEYTMKYYGWAWLYLSLTEVRNQVADWVHTWAFKAGLLTRENRVAGSRVDSYQKFSIENEGRFEAHSVLAKGILGFHGLNIALDDIIDIQHQSHPSDQLKLQRQWNSTISKIGRGDVTEEGRMGKIIVVGTRKFKGDFLEYLTTQFGDDMFVDIKTPYNADGSLLAPELHTFEFLDTMKHRDIVSWHSEMMQNPHPIEGGDWDKVHYAIGYTGKFDYDWACISVDRATTQNKTSDYTGFVVVLREKGTYNYFVLQDLTDRMTFEDTKNKIEEVYDYLRKVFLECGVIIRMEKQGGGEDLYNSANTQNYKWAQHCNLVHSNRPKEDKIRDALGTAETINKVKFLKNIVFIENLKKSKVVEQVRTFPGCLAFEDDAVDALSMAIMELEDQYIVKEKWRFY